LAGGLAADGHPAQGAYQHDPSFSYSLQVTGVSVTGNVRVQRSVIEREFKAAAAAKTHHDLAVELSKVSWTQIPIFSARGDII